MAGEMRAASLDKRSQHQNPFPGADPRVGELREISSLLSKRLRRLLSTSDIQMTDLEGEGGRFEVKFLDTGRMFPSSSQLNLNARNCNGLYLSQVLLLD